MKQFVCSKEPEDAEQCAKFADLNFEISKIGKEQRTHPESFPRQNVFGQNVRNEPNSSGTRQMQYKNPAVHGNSIRPTPFSGQQRPNFQPRAAGANNYRPPQQRSVRFDRPNALLVHDVSNRQMTACDLSSDHTNSDIQKIDGDDAIDAVVDSNDFIIPVFLNGVETSALRDSGSMIPLIVDEKFVNPQEINHSENILCSGAFDSGQRRLVPTANVTISNPCFENTRNVLIKAAVTKLP